MQATHKANMQAEKQTNNSLPTGEGRGGASSLPTGEGCGGASSLPDGEGRGGAFRSHALDALRGYAIATMILAATEAFSVLPRWMYHAQVPPPDHEFDPTIFGITWVDLIFPFFLFSMGAAIPLSLGRQHAKGVSLGRLTWKTVERFLKLTFFAIFIIHAFPFMMAYESDWLHYGVPVVAFVLLCLMLTPDPFRLGGRRAAALKWGAWAAAIALMLLQPYAGGKVFSLNDSDIIMLILANVSLTGSLIYLFTIGRPLYRLALLPFVAALFMAAHTDGSWAAHLTHTTLLPWLYNPAYQEYLLIIIPGTVAGEWIADWLRSHRTAQKTAEDCATAATGNSKASAAANGKATAASDGCATAAANGSAPYPLSAPWLVAAIAFALIVINVVLLFGRHLMANFALTCLLTAATAWLLRRSTDSSASFWRRLSNGGTYMLLLGLCLEAYEGGIRKDDVTLSYLFVTCGLAFFALLLLTIVCDHYHVRAVSVPLEAVGKNPMVAYVSSSMVVIPVLVLAHVYPLFEAMSANPLTGFLRGIILTALCMALTAWFTHRKWFWKT